MIALPTPDELALAWRRVAGARRVVVKIGSNLLTGGGPAVRREWLFARCAEMVQWLHANRERKGGLVVVTSGAVAAGAPLLGLGRRPRDLREKQAAAAAGQGVLMRLYEEAFSAHAVYPAQILITRDDCRDRTRYLNARDTLTTLLERNLVPVVNENDTVVTSEIRFGDNDTLAALVAGLVEAELLILLSDVDGLFERNPRLDPAARRLPLIAAVTPEVESLAGGTGSAVGSGGMVTKLKAAKKAARFGCHTVLANGTREGILPRILAGEPHGTLFQPETDPISSWKRWIVNGLTSMGEVELDPGAVAAICSGHSLLAKGITAVGGNFERGAAVYCRTREGRRIAKGLVNYSAVDLQRIAGRHSSEFEAILGFLANDEVIHRDNLINLEHCPQG